MLGRGTGVYGRGGIPQVYVARHGKYSSAFLYNMLALSIGAGAAAVFVASRVCESEVPLVGRARFVAFSRAAEERYGRWVSGALLGRKEMAGAVLPDDHPDAELVRRVGARVAAAVADGEEELRGWRYAVVDEPGEVNAACYPGGCVVVYTGLLDRLRREPFSGLSLEDKLAVILSHEAGHLVARHTNETLTRRLFVSAPFWALLLHASPTVAAAYKYLSEMPSSRLHESEADYLGIVLLAASGYDPRISPRFWSCGADIFEDKGFLADYVSTHPEHASRAAHTTLWLGQALEVRRLVRSGALDGGAGSLVSRLEGAVEGPRREHLLLDI